MRFDVDPTVHEVAGRRAGGLDGRRRIIGGSPLRLWTLTAAGAALLDRVQAGGDVDPGPVGGPIAMLLDRLVDAGVLHPSPDPASTAGAPQPEDVTVVVPVRDRPDELDRLLSALTRTAPAARVVVVDDASSDAVAHRDVATRHGARLVRREVSGGPAAARSDGIAVVDSELVAVVDSDCTPEPGWLEPLLAHLADDRVAAVAPRIRTGRGSGALATYERFRSPLDLGAVPAGVRPGSRVSYVPSAALVLRVAALASVGGFDRELLVGEDVDLVWRLVRAGWGVRYEPVAVVRHPARPGWAAWCRQRVGYGRSAAPLDIRHPGQVAPLRCSPWSAAGWAAVAAGHPVAGLAVMGSSAALLPRRLPSVAAGEAVRLAVTGHLGAGRQTASAIVRAWWPAALIGSVVSRGVRRASVVSVATVALDAALDARRVERGLPVRTAAMIGALAVLDDVAYGAGVWLGCSRAGSWRALLPSFSSR